jgi:PPP family 3-phenylpropionic acid transporter
MMFCVGSGYVTFYLTSLGYSAGEIGIVTAIFGVAAAILQPLLGRVADRSRRFGWKPLLLILAAACTAIIVGLLFCSQKMASGILYGLMLMCINCMMPMVNSASFYYQSRGIQVDFGVARGFGSLAYAVMSLILGQLTVLVGSVSIPAAGLLVIVVLALTVLSMPYGNLKSSSSDSSVSPTRSEHVSNSVQTCSDNATADSPHFARSDVQNLHQKKKSSGFLKKYPAFCIMLLGSLLMLSFHNLTNTYLLQMLQGVGGNSSNMGTALALAAVVELPVMFGFSRIVKKIPSHVLLVVSGIAYTAKAVIYLLAGSVVMIYAAQLLQMLSFALNASATVYFTDECMEAEDKVTGQSLMSMTTALGTVVGNLLGGWLIDTRGMHALLAVGVVIAFCAALTALAAALIYARQSKKQVIAD